MPEAEIWTIGRLLTWTTDYLGSQGAESPRLDAELLLAEARGCQRIDLYTVFEEEPSAQEITTFRGLVKRRAEGVPVAYLLGRREFYSLSFRVSPAVLIPRPETEFVVIELLDRARARQADGEPLQIVDVGTGSGILPICAAKNIAHCQITAIDISDEALEIARANAKEHQVEAKIDFIQGDLFDSLDENKQFDFVMSNPPYITEEEIETLSPEVRDHEPRLALVAGPSGMDVYQRLIPQAASRLKGGGWLIMEISPQLEERVCQAIQENGQFDAPHIVKDHSRLARVISTRKQAGDDGK